MHTDHNVRAICHSDCYHHSCWLFNKSTGMHRPGPLIFSVSAQHRPGSCHLCPQIDPAPAWAWAYCHSPPASDLHRGQFTLRHNYTALAEAERLQKMTPAQEFQDYATPPFQANMVTNAKGEGISTKNLQKEVMNKT